MFSRRVVVRRGPGLLGAVALGSAGYAVGAARSRRATPTPEPEQSSPDTRMDELQRAADLKRQGALTDEEFEREKRRILGG
jgi:Short C-terminal domain